MPRKEDSRVCVWREGCSSQQMVSQRCFRQRDQSPERPRSVEDQAGLALAAGSVLLGHTHPGAGGDEAGQRWWLTFAEPSSCARH